MTRWTRLPAALLVCLAWTSGCATLPAVKTAPDKGAGQVFVLARVHERSVFEKDAPADLVAPISDSYRIVPFRLTSGKSVEARVLADENPEPQVLVPKTELPAGIHYFVVSYDDVASRIGDQLDFVLQVIEVDSDPPVVLTSLRGTLAELVRGVRLGQRILCEVNLDEGYVKMRRLDLKLEGRGPWLSMERDYSNLPNLEDIDGVLGPGWTTGLPLQLELIASGPLPASNNLPAWVGAQRGAFYPLAELPPNDGEPHRVYANGTEFVRKGQRWSPERGRAGSLEWRDGTFIYRSMDGTLYTYPTPRREPLVIPEGADRTALPRATLEPPRPALLQHIDDRNHHRLTLTYTQGKSGPLLTRATDCVGRKFEYKYAELDHVAGPGSRVRLVRVTGPAGDVLDYRYDQRGLLAAFQIADYVEEYEYGTAGGSKLNPRFNLERVRRPVQGSTQELAFSYLAPADVPAALLRLHPGLPATSVVRHVARPGNGDVSIRYQPEPGNLRLATSVHGTTEYRLNAYGNAVEQRTKGKPIMRWTWGIDQGLPGNNVTSYAEGDQVAKYEYDGRGNLSRIVYADGKVDMQRWDVYGQLLERRGSDGLFERHERDEHGNDLKHTTPLVEFNLVYNPSGDLVESAIANTDVRTVYRYDRYGNVSQDEARTDELVWTKDHVRDERGRLLRTLTADGAIFAEYRYDQLGRVVFKREGNEWSIISYDIDGDSRVIAQSEKPQLFGRDVEKKKGRPKKTAPNDADAGNRK